MVDDGVSGEQGVAGVGPLAPEPFEELLGVQGVVAHVDALPDLAVSGADLLPLPTGFGRYLVQKGSELVNK